MRGIANVSGVSCHIACALQLLCHVVTPLSNAIIRSSVQQQQDDNDGVDLRQHLVTLFRALLEKDASEPVDPTKLYHSLRLFQSRLDFENVGDVSTVLHELLTVMSSLSRTWKHMVDDTLRNGRTRQVLQGRLQQETAVVVRTKQGKPKVMACPFPLLGKNMESIPLALTRSCIPKSIPSYPWDTMLPDSYEETKEDCLVEATATTASTLTNEWRTTKAMHIEELPTFLFLSVERFGFDGNGDTVLSNEVVTIPLVMDLNALHFSNGGKNNTSSPPPSSNTMVLRGSVLHITEESWDEEGHVVSLIRSAGGSWTMLDDERVKEVEEDEALQLMQGHRDDTTGCFTCSILLVYEKVCGMNEIDP